MGTNQDDLIEDLELDLDTEIIDFDDIDVFDIEEEEVEEAENKTKVSLEKSDEQSEKIDSTIKEEKVYNIDTEETFIEKEEVVEKVVNDKGNKSDSKKDKKKQKKNKKDIELNEEEIKKEVSEETEKKLSVINNTFNNIKNIFKNKKHVHTEECALCIYTDNVNEKIVKYFEQSGVIVTQWCETIQDVQRCNLLNDKMRIIVIDTGSGKFSGVIKRREIIDILGLSNEDCFITVYSINNKLQSDMADLNPEKEEEIDWKRYSTTAVVVANTLRLNEKYSEGFSNSNILQNQVTLNDKVTNKGARFIKPDWDRIPKIEDRRFFDIRIVTSNLDKEDKQVKAFKPRY